MSYQQGQGLPPQLEQLLEKIDVLLRKPEQWLPALLLLFAVLWVGSGVYTVGPGEVAIVRQFGREVSQNPPGLRYHIPWPIQSATVVDVSTIRRAEIGFRTTKDSQTTVPGEALMLTGDENIVEVQLFVQYVVDNPSEFLFRAEDPQYVLGAAAEVALRGVVGQYPIDYTMTEGRVTVQDKVHLYLQDLLKTYRTGLIVTETRLLVVDPPEQVIDAFHEVVRALEDRERVVQEAEGYREDVVPKARGEAAQLEASAEAYKERRILEARGDAAQFRSVLAEYEKAPAVTRDRLYLETIERTMPDLRKIIVDEQVGGKTLPLLSIDGMLSGEGASR